MRYLLALLLVPLLFVAGCGDTEEGSGESGSASGSGSGSGELSGVTVSGSQDEKPALKFDNGFSVEKTEVDVIAEGDGDEVGKNDVVTVDYLGVNGKNGKEFDSSWSRDQEASFSLGPGMIAGFNTALAGQKVGSRVLTAIPPEDGYGQQGNPQAGIGGKDTLLFVIDIRGTSPSKATGTEVDPPADTPTLEVDENDVPTGFAKGGDTAPAPDQTTSHLLIEGEGAEVEKGQTVTMHFLGQVYPAGKVLASSWQQGPQPIPVGEGQPIKCFDELVGEKIGSRVMLICPPADAFGKKGNPQAGVEAGDSVIFAVDLLAAS